MSNSSKERDFRKESDSLRDAPEPPPDDLPVNPKVWVLCCLASFAGLAFGFDVGGSGGTFVFESFREFLGWHPTINGDLETSQQSWIAVTFSLGALFGSLPSGMMSDWIGRKWSLVLYSALLTVGCAIQLGTVNIDMLYAGRVIGGFGIGGLSCLTNMYNVELAPKKVRGTIATLWQLGITAGIVLAGLLNLGFREWSEGWRFSYGGNIVFSLTLFIGLFFFPESPRFLVKKGKIEEARAALTKVRTTEQEVDYEMWEIEEEVRQYPKEGTWCETFSTHNKQLYRTTAGMIFFILQQFSGINAIMFFAPVIIGDFFGTDAALYGNLAIQGVNFFMTFVCVWAIDRYGRKILLLSGGIGQAISQLAVGLCAGPYDTGLYRCYAFDMNTGELDKSAIVSDVNECLTSAPIEQLWEYQNNVTLGIFIIVFCSIYVAFFSYSWGPLAWVICSEIQSLKCRAKAMTMSTFIHWGFAAIIGQVFPLMIQRDALDLYGTFLLFSAVCVIMTLWGQTCLPETKGVPLEEIDDMWAEFSPGWNPPVYIPKADRELSQVSDKSRRSRRRSRSERF